MKLILLLKKISVPLNDSVSYYTFLETGQFDVSLIVKSDKYCTDTIKKSILINESLKLTFTLNSIVLVILRGFILSQKYRMTI